MIAPELVSAEVALPAIVVAFVAILDALLVIPVPFAAIPVALSWTLFPIVVTPLMFSTSRVSFLGKLASKLMIQ